ncbi:MULTISPECIES: flavin reductase family protein [Rufibacter]|uniref:Flavin reductase (DIM6/NTAB) family NADH-FMN oxidoreductase RutF n=1 Tax=Rufibacter quisquiliarum TaxID=1549639 RepID=A0A839GN42_9BACT|nr:MULTISPECIES: flavin reductase [Rufibacter]MBA9076965.1 flavin reductase (DIM6/NTAB) family NADH-FMN oxidoreductase RutF [Rufibacter quisquiliarum]
MSDSHFSTSDILGMELAYRANFVTSLSGFKSLCLVGTVDGKGTTNLSVYTQVFHVGANPPLIGMIVRPDSVVRDTLNNIIKTGHYTLNHVKPSFYQAAHHTSAHHSQSEFDLCGFTPQFSENHPAPYVREANIKVGLKLVQRTYIKLNGTILVIGEVVEALVPQDCLQQDGYVDLEKAETMTASGLNSYHVTQRLGRLPAPQPDAPLQAAEAPVPE